MPASSLLTLIDDIASTLDDVALMTKVAAKKTAGVLGDDLALNAQQVSGVKADRELHVVWSVAKGSLLNKVILIPAALIISQFLPWLVIPLLMVGGAFLCFEGFEKVFARFFHKTDLSIATAQEQATADTDPVAFEKEKIKGAIRTDFILSAEIIIITLGSVAESEFLNQVLVLIGIGLTMTIGVYGLVAAIVKIDDLGLWLMRETAKLKWLGRALLVFAPLLMKFLGYAGTLAMFMVGGGIISHAFHALRVDNLLLQIGIDVGIGLITGGICVLIVELIRLIKTKKFAN